MIVAMWSGGKDSCLSVWRAVKDGIEVDRLICMIHKGKSRAHGVDREIIEAQGRSMDMEILFQESTWESYEDRLNGIFRDLNVDKAIFGDIYLREHRDWIERVCNNAGVEPLFPLWGDDTLNLAKEFISEFEALVIAVRRELPVSLLGRKYDENFIGEVVSLGLDPCGENGEFHTYVYDGPLFKTRVKFEVDGGFESDKYMHLRLKIRDSWRLLQQS